MTLSPIFLNGVQVSYGRRQILTGIDLDVYAGEIFGLIGLNGVGKTTLIRSMLGLQKAAADIRLSGLPPSDRRARHTLVYLPERYQPQSLLKGWEVLSLGLAAYGLPLNRECAAQMCRDLDFDPDQLGRLVRDYSKGMGQKLGLAAAFLAERPLAILDEPMSGLDPRARICLKECLLAQRQAGRTVFFSSHILSDVEELCDRIGILHQGKLIYCGPPADLITQTAAPNLERAFLAAIGG